MTFVDWLRNVAAVGTFLALVALGLVKWFAPKWIDHRFRIRLEEFKAAQQAKLEEFKTEQQKELEGLKSEQQRELERLKHRLSSRISKIHKKEFEVLPKAWLMLHELHGSVILALELTIQSFPNFEAQTQDEFEEFLKTEPAIRLSDNQKQSLRTSPDRTKYFVEALRELRVDDANEKQRVFRNYLIEHRIFMTDDLRWNFSTACDALARALNKYAVGHRVKDWKLQSEGQNEVAGLNNMIDDVEQAIQQRLRYEEA